MTYVLKGPVQLHQVCDLLQTLTSRFTNQHGDICKYAWQWCPYHQTELEFWSNSNSLWKNAELPRSEVSETTHDMICRDFSNGNATLVSKLGASIHIKNHRKDRIIRTDVWNKTLLDDFVRGQTIPSVNNEFAVESVVTETGYYSDFFNAYVEYRNQILRESQQRLNRAVSAAAFGMMLDLRLT